MINKALLAESPLSFGFIITVVITTGRHPPIILDKPSPRQLLYRSSGA